jgi:two-component system OmpR family sensor kinase
MRSFRSALALRIAFKAFGVALVMLGGAALLFRRELLANLDAGLLEVARLEAQYGTSGEPPGFRFRGTAGARARAGEPEAHQTWAQLVGRDGTVLARGPDLHRPLPVPQAALARARQGEVSFASHRIEQERIRSALFPIGPEGGAGPLLQVATSLAPLQSSLNDFVWLLAGLAALGAVLAGWLGWIGAGRAVAPALALTAEAESIGVNELGRRVAVPGSIAEFHRMAEAFNALLARLEQAVSGTRRFTADASHELRAPLTVLRGELELALSRPRTPEEYAEVLHRCLDEVLRLVRLADDLLTLTRIQGGVVGSQRASVDLDDVVGQALARKQTLAEARGVSLAGQGTAGVVLGDGDLLLRAVDALIEHAIMASPAGGTVRVRLLQDHRRGVEVTDAGPGLKPDEISGVFQRFYRSQRPRIRSEESGLGLPIARAVALSHGGTLEYTGNDPGASFRLSLPPVPGEAPFPSTRN